jgi:hypothetical protein
MIQQIEMIIKLQKVIILQMIQEIQILLEVGERGETLIKVPRTVGEVNQDKDLDIK